MDWNNDGKIDGRDYALYKSVIDTDSGSSGSGSYSGGSSSAKWIVGLIIVYVVLKLMGLD
jgi:hypothetical protein